MFVVVFILWENHSVSGLVSTMLNHTSSYLCRLHVNISEGEPLQLPDWGTSMGSNWGSLILRVLAAPVARGVNCVQLVQMCTSELLVYCHCTTVQAIYILNWFSYLPNCAQFVANIVYRNTVQHSTNVHHVCTTAAVTWPVVTIMKRLTQLLQIRNF